MVPPCARRSAQGVSAEEQRGSSLFIFIFFKLKIKTALAGTATATAIATPPKGATPRGGVKQINLTALRLNFS
jgi:hypothetical protein